MNKFTEHIPTFVDTDGKRLSIEFEAVEELLAHDKFKRWAGYENFSHFAMSSGHIMAILDDGFEWWVVGFIQNPEAVELPKWDGRKHRARLQDGSEVVLQGDEVTSSCGDVLTLRDGTKATDLDY